MSTQITGPAILRRIKFPLAAVTIPTTVCRVALACLLAMVCLGDLVASAQDQANAWSKRGTFKSPMGNQRFRSDWHPNKGLHFKIQSSIPDEVAEIIIAPTAKDSGVWVSRKKEGMRVRTQDQRATIHPERLPSKVAKNLPFTLTLRDTRWTLYQGHSWIATWPASFLSPKALLQKADEFTPPKRATRFQKIGELFFSDDFLIAEGDEEPLVNWDALTGEWAIHSALEDAKAQKTSTKLDAKPLQAQRSSNFYSLKGHATSEEGVTNPALIAAGYYFFDFYRYKAACQVSGSEVGLAFYIEDDTNYYSLTLLRVDDATGKTLMRLQRMRDGEAPVLLAASEVIVLGEQWVMPEVRLSFDRIQCFLDGDKVMDVNEVLPPGGQFGLVVAGTKTVRFDDVSVRPNDSMRWDDTRTQAFYERDSHGPVWGSKSFFQRMGFGKKKPALFSSKHKDRQWIALGPAHQDQHIFSAEFTPASDDVGFGVMAGYRDRQSPHYRVHVHLDAKQRNAVTLSVSKGTHTAQTPLQSAVLPQVQPGSPMQVAVDNTRIGMMRIYVNKTLALAIPTAQPIQGAYGLFVDGGVKVQVSDLAYDSERRDININQYEKNSIFVDDPFMKHWSSPEGEWISDKDGLTWHKSDFFGRFSLRMPVVKQSEIHLGVKEKTTTGGIIVKVDDTTLSVYQAGAKTAALTAPIAPWLKAGTAKQPALLNMHYEDRTLMIQQGDTLVGTLNMAKPLQGTRIRIKGFDHKQLHFSRTEQHQVKEFLFTEVPHEWNMAGGRWQVINRFQCDPRWSHMNGESKENLAAMWSKYQFEGDFCVEMYAGIRHGWYTRAGDLNLTIMNQIDSVNSGYTITTTGWDPNHSQEITTLYKNGKVVATSDQYLVPRQRHNNVRKNYNPLLKQGQRSIHGAWYYIKLRRIDNRLKFYFDNELVFDVEDKEPIDAGGLGLWTYRNSMMVARLKVSADGFDVKPRQATAVDATTVSQTLASFAGSQEAKTTVAKPASKLSMGSVELHTMHPSRWQGFSSVFDPYVAWGSEVSAPGLTSTQPFWTITNQGSGGGEFAMRYQGKPMLLSDVAGFTFYVKRTAGAQFNFHYELVSNVSAGASDVPRARYFHRLSGTDYAEGEFTMAGETPIDGVDKLGVDGLNAATWQKVTVWIPTMVRQRFAPERNIALRVVGFGALQPSFVQQGLTGNAPGDAYGIKGFAPIVFATKSTALSGFTGDNIAVRDPSGATQTGKAAVNTVLSQLSVDYHVRSMEVPGQGQFDLHVVRLPETAPLEVSWDKDRWHTLKIGSGKPWSEPRLRNATLVAKGQRIAGQGTTSSYFNVPVHPVQVSIDQLNPCRVEMYDAQNNHQRKVSITEPPTKTRPILVSVGKLTPHFYSFDDEAAPTYAPQSGERLMLRYNEDGDQYYRVKNEKYGQRLRMALSRQTINYATYPLVQFRYLPSAMTNVSYSPRGSSYVKLSEDYKSAHDVALVPWESSPQWHTWLGNASGAISDQRYNPNVYRSGYHQWGSFNRFDQTGAHSSLGIDDMVFGPAVRTLSALDVTPTYASHQAIRDVFVAVNKGAEPYDTLAPEVAQALRWIRIKHGDTFKPKPLGKPAKAHAHDGVYQIFVKAVTASGTSSTVTSIPCLLDTMPMVAKAKVKDSIDPVSNGSTLEINFTTGDGSPINLSQLTYKFEGKPISVAPMLNSMAFSPTRKFLKLNYPYILREQLSAVPSKGKYAFTISGIRDGAGNASPDITVSIPIDVTKDKEMPTYLAPKLPPTHTPLLQLLGADAKRNMSVSKGVQQKHYRVKAAAPYMELTVSRKDGTVTLKDKRHRLNPDELEHVAIRFMSTTIPKKKIEGDLNKAGLYIGTRLGNKEYRIYFTDVDLRKRSKKLRESKSTVLLSSPHAPVIKQDKWQSVIVPLGQIMKPYLDTLKGKQRQYQGIHIGFERVPKPWRVRIDQVIGLKPSAKDAQFAVDGFDRSGVKGAHWSYVDHQGKSLRKGFGPLAGIALNKQRIPGGKPAWLQFEMEDRAGNRAHAVWVPVIAPALPKPPAPKPKKETTKPAVAPSAATAPREQAPAPNVSDAPNASVKAKPKQPEALKQNKPLEKITPQIDPGKAPADLPK